MSVLAEPVNKEPSWPLDNRLATEPVNKTQTLQLDNRLEMQRRILAYLRTRDKYNVIHGGDMPSTGNVVDALGMPRTKSSFASVSRSLRSRLVIAGKVETYRAMCNLQGKGLRYCLPNSNSGNGAA
jgi:hypothetical protein